MTVAPEPKRIPTKEEISKLPKWAIVAFVARCARRVQPLIGSAWPQAPTKHVTALDAAITLAERAAAAGGTTTDDAIHASRAAVNDAADAARALAAALEVNLIRASAHAAAHAAVISAAALGSAASVEPSYAVDDAVKAARAALEAALECSPRFGIATGVAIRTDFEILSAAALAGHWTDETPVSPEVFGPMWALGFPAGWPHRAALLGDPLRDPLLEETLLDTPKHGETVPIVIDDGEAAVREPIENSLRLSVFLPEFVDTDEASEKLLDLIRALNAYHIACGGSGLKVEDWQMFEPANEPAEVLS